MTSILSQSHDYNHRRLLEEGGVAVDTVKLIALNQV